MHAALTPDPSQCNALVMSASMAAVSEALALGKRLNVNPAVLTDVLNSGSGRWVPSGLGCLGRVGPARGLPAAHSDVCGMT